MAWDERSDRAQVSFWEDLGIDSHASWYASRCFPEAHLLCSKRVTYEYLLGRVADNIKKAPMSCKTDPKNPAFWYMQGHDFDEMAARAIAAIAMVKLQREATPPPPPQPDRFAEVAQALLMQGALQQRLEGPDSRDDQYYDAPPPQGPIQPQQEPFNPDDYPRFQTRRS